ncbi:hypothetical protein JTE90_009041 [Oedothorax gibbosus]|uniref:[histone H4]-lysine(20) N-methyltransferase n=1 Tax=Oedothorax gibbosus TaxID=931172 RepID=A0AAV6VI19_9ARAC|nr:hypothetical protein JTE90_009041 [Oedothorax gibbosus]
MSRMTRRKNLRKVTEPSKIPEKSTKTAHQTDISEYFAKQEEDAPTETAGLPEGSLPSPDDAALPCSTTLGLELIKNQKDVKGLVTEDIKEPIVPVEKTQKISDMTNKVLKEVSKKRRNKKPMQQQRNSQVTDFFPVRRSNRKPLPFVKKEKQKTIEEAILSGKEEGFEIKEFPDKGRGVITTRDFQPGDFVIEYHGELIDNTEAAKREAEYAAKENTGCYMYYFKCNDKRYCIDATKESDRLGRLINHSKLQGNLRTQPLLVDCKPRLAFFARRTINAGEELLYDYGDRSKDSLESHPWLKL